MTQIFYCVLKGWDNGVFKDFDAFMRAVEEYPGAVFKRCRGVHEARLYLKQQKVEERLNVYVDGCTLRNGCPDASGGIDILLRRTIR